MTKVEQYKLWKRQLTYIPPCGERSPKEQEKFERYTGYLAEAKPTERDWADHTFAMLQKEHK